MAGAQGAFLANLFPTKDRFSGIAVTRERNGVMIWIDLSGIVELVWTN